MEVEALRRERQAKKENDAAAKMQALRRGKSGRARVATMRAERAAAAKAVADLSLGTLVKITRFAQNAKKRAAERRSRQRLAAVRMQARSRGNSGRMQVRTMRAEREAQKQSDASISMEALCRGKIARLRVRFLRAIALAKAEAAAAFEAARLRERQLRQLKALHEANSLPKPIEWSPLVRDAWTLDRGPHACA